MSSYLMPRLSLWRNLFSWKAGLNMHWISITSLSKQLEFLQSYGNVGLQTQFCKNSELADLEKLKAGHHPDLKLLTGSQDTICPYMSKRITAQILLKTGVCTVHQFYCHNESCSWLLNTDCGFGPLPSFPALKWHSLQTHSDGLHWRLSRMEEKTITPILLCFCGTILGTKS